MPSLPTEITMLASGPRAPAAAAPATPAPATFRNLRRSILSIYVLLVRIPEVREAGQVIRVRAHHVGGDGAVADQGQLNVDHVIRELPAVEKPCRARVVVGQDVGEQDLGDGLRLGGRMAEMLERRDKAVLEADWRRVAVERRSVGARIDLVEDVLALRVVEHRV